MGKKLDEPILDESLYWAISSWGRVLIFTTQTLLMPDDTYGKR